MVEYKRLDEHSPEVVASCYHFQFAGQGQRKTPVADAKTLVQISLLLPGEQAAKVEFDAAQHRCPQHKITLLESICLRNAAFARCCARR